MAARVRAGLPAWKARYEELLRLLQWTPQRVKELSEGETISAEDELEVCPEDSSHVMPREAMARHVWRCRLLKQGVKPDRVILLPSSAPAYTNAMGVVSFLSGHGEHTATHLPAEKTSVQPTLSFVAPHEDGVDDLLESDERQSAPRTPAELIEWQTQWKGVPLSQRRLPAEELDGTLMSSWVVQHAERLGVNNVLRDADDAAFVVELVKACPDAVTVASELRPMLTDKTRSFVIELWKELTSQVARRHLKPPETSNIRARHELVQALNRKRYQEAEQSRQAAAVSERAQAYDALVSQAAAVRAARSFEHVPASQITDASLGIKTKTLKQAAQEKSALELMQEQRDYKRRRQRYRARNTHLTKRRPAEVARDMIRERMQELFPTVEHEAGELT